MEGEDGNSGASIAIAGGEHEGVLGKEERDAILLECLTAGRLRASCLSWSLLVFASSAFEFMAESLRVILLGGGVSARCSCFSSSALGSILSRSGGLSGT